MSCRPTYAVLCPLPLNVSLQRDEFLRAMARQLGGPAKQNSCVAFWPTRSCHRSGKGCTFRLCRVESRVGGRVLVRAWKGKGLGGLWSSRGRTEQP